MSTYRIGLDVGSTTAKAVVLDNEGVVIFSKYERHQADISKTVGRFLDDILGKYGNIPVSVSITGSVGMGIAERFSVPFIQEVIAATEYVRINHPGISTLIDIGGEDAKIVYFRPNGNADIRMNGNCAGGTGAFIDQMAQLLAVEVSELDALAAGASHIHPIAARCGVFSKTDVQNLISKNVSKEDIAASVLRAVAVQTVVTLSHGCEIAPKIMFCGGPLTFIPSLRKAFIDYLSLSQDDYVLPENANLIPAWGAALSADAANIIMLADFIALPETSEPLTAKAAAANKPSPIFASEEEYRTWREEKSHNNISTAPLGDHTGAAWLGIDSGSTTTKLVVTDDLGRVIFTYYAPNHGNPIMAVRDGLEEFRRKCSEAGVDPEIMGSCSTGYGEDLIKAAFSLDGGIIETIAHYLAASQVDQNVSFILDIGGQDMKAIFVDHGVLNRMEINEACSSGCGSFIETFSGSLGYKVEDFARAACLAKNPSDLGTRCTVFMNSRVKQVLREGSTIEDIAAGLSYSVVKNCLYKVLKLKKKEELGNNIVVQGGTMRNDSVVRALENLTGAKVSRSDMPELMGAYGCAIHARGAAEKSAAKTVDSMLGLAEYTTRPIDCGGCENHCYVQKYTFSGGNVFYSGNKCEKIFTNGSGEKQRGRNLSAEKYALLFDRNEYADNSGMTIGIPRVLNLYENYPFWYTLLGECGFRTRLSSHSTYASYETGIHSVMSDNICFPAKLAHSHIYELSDAGVERIFFPYVVLERPDGKEARNSYNCPVVAGYPELIRNTLDLAVPLDRPIITFRDEKMLARGCRTYLAELGIPAAKANAAVKKALRAQDEFERKIKELNIEALAEARLEGKLSILLAGRPYHDDPLVQHKISDMIAEMGVVVLTEDIARREDSIDIRKSHLVTQWTYINRIMRAAMWAGEQPADLHLVQMTSFGCGPDAFLLDEIGTILKRHGKSHTLLKIDDMNNIGSLKLRVRSLVESIRYGGDTQREPEPFATTRRYTKEERHRTLIAPFFTDYISPLVPAAFKLIGYDLVQLGESDEQSSEYGLKYANNEVCYPATLVVGDLIKALDSGKYDPADTAVIITQTGGQCRATNYVTLLKKGMVEAGYSEVPVLSLAMGGLSNDQPGFKVNWLKVLPIALVAILFGDCVSKFYHASAVREKVPGEAMRLREHYLEEAKKIIARNDTKALYALVGTAADHFNSIIDPDYTLPKVGIVGEIYLKFNSFAHKRIVDWFIGRKIEVIPPVLTDFFMEAFVNKGVKHRTGIQKSPVPPRMLESVYSLIWKKIEHVNALGSRFRHFTPFHNIFEQAGNGSEVITLSAQFGEGWLLPAEVVSFAKQGVNNVVSLQPFGCIANHIISKGAEKKIKTLYPQMNLLSLDFDSGVSDVNITNRLLLMTNNLK